MSQNFVGCDRGQVFLLPPSLTDWVPEDHLVWSVLGAVEQMDLSAFYGAYRCNGQGRAAYDPAMMVALLLYAYAIGNRSSRGIERACEVNVAFKVITALEVPDHSTIAEFRRRHEVALGDVFGSVLALCAEAGLVSVGEIAIDGTKIKANASKDRNRTYESIVLDILEQAERADRDDDQRHGSARGDELPKPLRTREGRRVALVAARERLQAEREQAQDRGEPVVETVELELDPERFMTGGGGRREWLREGHRELERRRELDARPIDRGRAERLDEAKRRMDEALAFEHAANDGYETHQASRVTRTGRTLGGQSGAYAPPLVPEGKINIVDHDSRAMRTQGQPAVQGYNAQAAVTTGQIIVAAEVTINSPDFGHLQPMADATLRELAAAGVDDRPGAIIADAGYWHTGQIETITADGIVVLLPPDGGLRHGQRPGWTGGLYDFMRRVLSTDLGRDLYALRKRTVEPVFGQIKFNRRCDRFQRRGRAAARSEWRLITATHNLLKLHNHWTTPVTA
jgi:transposase